MLLTPAANNIIDVHLVGMIITVVGMGYDLFFDGFHTFSRWKRGSRRDEMTFRTEEQIQRVEGRP